MHRQSGQTSHDYISPLGPLTFQDMMAFLHACGMIVHIHSAPRGHVNFELSAEGEERLGVSQAIIPQRMKRAHKPAWHFA